MKNKIISLWKFAFTILTIVLITVSCRENTLISSKLSPAKDTASVNKIVLGCITHTYFDDTVQTDINYSGIPVYQGVGTMNDWFFGNMTGTTFFQIAPSAPGYNPFADASVIGIDSAVLVLPYSYGGLIFGDTSNTNLTQSYQVFYMADTLGYFSTYFSYSNKSIDELNPLSAPFTTNIYHLADSQLVTGAHHSGLRIRLNGYFMSLLKNALATSYTATDPSTAFVSAFNGICVRPTDLRQINNAMPYFELDGTDQYSTAGVILYYRSSNAGIIDTLTQSYDYNYAACTHFNKIQKDYSRFPVNALLHSTSKNDSIVALQNQPGAGIDIKIHGINSLPKNIVINKAELQLTMLPAYNGIPLSSNNTNGAPYKLYPNAYSVGNGSGGVYPDSATGVMQQYLVADRYPTTSLTPLTVMDGYLHQIVYGGTTYNTYTIDLPRELMQAMVQHSDSLHFHINGTQEFYGAYHLVAGGGSYSDSMYRAKFVVVYSKLSQ